MSCFELGCVELYCVVVGCVDLGLIAHDQNCEHARTNARMGELQKKRVHSITE